MKGLFNDANFPRTAEGRVYHLGLRQGEVANRILTVGDPARARRVAELLDTTPTPFVLQSERGFLTITGTYNGTPVTIIAIGMGIANMDFFVRECRECVLGDMAIIRLGSCGGLAHDLPVGSFALPRSCVSVTRNYDYDFTASYPGPEVLGSANSPYRISKPVDGDSTLHQVLEKAVEDTRPESLKNVVVRGDVVNAAADSFYSSQGRITSFPDHNAGLISHLVAKVPDVATLEMETHHLFHLASVYPRETDDDVGSLSSSTVLTRGAGSVEVDLSAHTNGVNVTAGIAEGHGVSKGIYATAIQMIFAQRRSQAFITPEDVVTRENWAGKACLEALQRFELQVGSSGFVG
ncbi:hypothetical protein FRB99_007367 [Tulasnella sp. 403]|nr:hypothetical protein FRB99_007367 [Tulasnella sp. 403]